jgi:LuxR family maltose regulon positive regulatory protein
VALAVLDAVRASRTESAPEALALAREAERLGTSRLGPDRWRAAAETCAVSRHALGLARLRTGDLEGARNALADAAGANGVGETFPGFRADCLGLLALTEALAGRLVPAQRRAAEALALADGAIAQPHAARLALAWVALEQHDLRAARVQVGRTVHQVPRGDRLLSSLADYVLAGLEKASGHRERALALLEATGERARGSDPWVAGLLRTEGAMICLASGDRRGAAGLLAAVEQRDDPRATAALAAWYAEAGRRDAVDDALSVLGADEGTLQVTVTRRLLEAANTRDRSPARSRAALDRALRLAAPQGLRRPFLEAAPSVQRILTAEPRLLRSNDWLRHPGGMPDGARVPAQRVASAEPPTPAVVEQLTGKEMEVLGHLAELLSTEEIAEKMFVSVNTVRTHVRSILRKLGVTRRNAAVRKARELGWLSG